MSTPALSKKLLSNDTISDTNSTIIVEWMVHSNSNRYMYYSLCVLSGGLVHVLCTMYPDWKRRIVSRTCMPNIADTAVVSLVDGGSRTVEVKHGLVNGFPMVAIEVSCKRYWASSEQNWDIYALPDIPDHFSEFIVPSKSSLHRDSRENLYSLYGSNNMELPTVSFMDTLATTMCQPFYLFQYFAVVLWMVENYVLYACVIILITGGAIYLTVSETIFNLSRLHDLAGASFRVRLVDPVTGEISQNEISDRELVPGDRFVVNQGSPLPCDAILLSGRVSVDESCLTGESVPVNKVPIESALFNLRQGMDDDAAIISKQQNSILFSGTRVLLCTPPSAHDRKEDCPEGVCVAVAYRTGFRSAKGQLIATLLNPKENFMSFFSDAMWVILFMAVLCTGLYMWSGAYLRENGTSWKWVFIKYLDAITIAVPPGLTASLTVATGISIDRLRKKDIFVSESTRVNWAGIIGAACFDKTGTLTEERLHFKGVSAPLHLITPGTDGDNVSVELAPEATEMPKICHELMGTCHALAMINGAPVGDPLEVELFRASGFALASSGLHGPPSGGDLASAYAGGKFTPDCKYDILRHFEFSSDRLRAGSLVRKPNGEVTYYCKGSPEAILKLVRPDSVPNDINKTLTGLSKRGFRVLALCYKNINSVEDSRVLLTTPQDSIEEGSIFLGLIFLSNALKADTIKTINTLRGADIKCNMITGDHIYTAIAIATDCGLLTKDEDVNIIDANETGTSIQVTSTLSEQVISRNLTEFLCNTMHPMGHNSGSHASGGQIAVTGRGLVLIKEKHSHVLKIILERTQVFARMKPSDKQFIVEELQHMTEAEAHVGLAAAEARNSSADIGSEDEEAGHMQVSAESVNARQQHEQRSMRQTLIDRAATLVDMHNDGRGSLHVLFCGDGANDMAALRSATVGVSLCEAETSVAAPVTSRLQTPGAVVDVIREGRCSLITAYVLVSFNIMYGTIQLFNTVMMYNYGLNLGDNTYLIQDLFYTLVLGLAISINPPADTLSKELPPQRFFTKYFFFKLFSQLICFPIFQLIALRALSREEWYDEYDAGDDPLSETYAYETSVIASMGLAQLMISSVVATVDEPFRQPWFKNIYHVGALLCQGGFLFYQIFGRTSYFMRHILECRPLRYGFCWKLVMIIAFNVLVSGMLSKFADYLKRHFS